MLTATIPAYSRSDYALLGKLLVHKEPKLAAQLKQNYLPDVKPLQTDLTRISGYFDQYCGLIGVSAAEHKGKLCKRSKVHVQQKFVAAILKIYAPQVFVQPVDIFPKLLNNFLNKTLSETLCVDKGRISVIMRMVIVWVNTYEDFSGEVEAMVQQLQIAE